MSLKDLTTFDKEVLSVLPDYVEIDYVRRTKDWVLFGHYPSGYYKGFITRGHDLFRAIISTMRMIHNNVT